MTTKYRSKHMLAELGFLRAEMEANRKYIFERPFVILAGAFAAATTLKGMVDTAALPALVTVLLSFNLWFTFNRIQSTSRIVAYLQYVHTPERSNLWIGWEAALRKYRMTPQQPESSSDVLDQESEKRESRFYGPILAFHMVSAICITVFVVLRLFNELIPSSSPSIIQWFLIGIDCGALTGLFMLAIIYRPSRVRSAIDLSWKRWVVVHHTEIVKIDIQEIERRLERAKRLAEPAYVNMPAYHAEYFPLFDIAGNELKQKGLIINWRAHLAGLRHKTVNAIFITIKGELILQRRAPTTIIFPSRYSLSAGGHVGQATPDRIDSIDPLKKMADEVQEELGLQIAPKRFIPIGDAHKGLPNFLHVWVFQHNQVQAVLTVFDPQANHVGVSCDPKSKNPLSETARADLTELVRAETLGKISEDVLNDQHLTLFTRNIELCHFYTVVVGENEIAKIRFTDGEVAGFRRASLDSLVQEARSLDTTTDSLYTLFFDRTDIETELRKRIAEVGK